MQGFPHFMPENWSKNFDIYNFFGDGELEVFFCFLDIFTPAML